jgi:hypothetical protein
MGHFTPCGGAARALNGDRSHTRLTCTGATTSLPADIRPTLGTYTKDPSEKTAELSAAK